MVAVPASTLPTSLSAGLRAHGVFASIARQVSHQPPVSILLAAFIGYNPVQRLLGAHALSHLSNAATIGRLFVSQLI
jgi:hypothetical protein